MRPNAGPLILIALICSLMCSCKQQGVRESLDPKTLVSVITIDPEVVLFRYAFSGEYGRDFVSTGPLELIGSPGRGYYLWLSVWGTFPDGTYRHTAQPEKIIITSGTQRFSLRRTTDNYADINVSRPAYPSPISGAQSGYFEITSDQLLTMASDSSFAIQIGDHKFEFWGDQQIAHDAFRRFVEEATAY